MERNAAPIDSVTSAQFFSSSASMRSRSAPPNFTGLNLATPARKVGHLQPADINKKNSRHDDAGHDVHEDDASPIERLQQQPDDQGRNNVAHIAAHAVETTRPDLLGKRSASHGIAVGCHGSLPTPTRVAQTSIISKCATAPL